ncbi:nuclear transport factor 2 family protein [Thermodesulfobacteriota bacterium]
MKKWAVIIVSLLLVMVSADLSKAGDIEEIQAISDKILEARNTKDIDSYADLIGGSMGYTHSFSNVLDYKKHSKEELKFMYKSWFKGYDSYEMTSVSRNISIIGNTAITYGLRKLKYKKTGALSQPEEKLLRVTNAYIKENGKWKLVLFHSDTGAK